MDRLAIAGLALGLVIGGVGLTRGRDALALRGEAAVAEARVATAQRDLDRLRALPADVGPLPAIADTLRLVDRDLFAQPTPLEVRAQLDPGPPKGHPWAPLAGETVKITMRTDASPLAAVAWLHLALDKYTVLLTGIQWDGRTGGVHAVALGP